MHCIELNDTGLTISSHDRQGELSPGFALVDKDQVTTGAAAQARARLLPRQTLSRFWQRLGVTPLASPMAVRLGLPAK